METITKPKAVFVGENEKLVFFEAFFEGQLIRFAKEKNSEQVWICFEDAHKILYPGKDQKDYFTDEVLDNLNEEKKRTGIFPIQTIQTL
jgi:hypothetical protein